MLLQSGCLASHLQEHFGHVPGRADAEFGNAKNASLWGICCCRAAEVDRQVLCDFSQARFLVRYEGCSACAQVNADWDL